MSTEKITAWCMEHGTEKRAYTWINDEHYKITFASGSTYEYQRKQISNREYQVTIWINGETVQDAIWEDGWLESGNYGAKMIRSLLGCTAA